MRRRLLAAAVVSACGALCAVPARGQTPVLRKIGELDVPLLGISATVDPLNPVVPKNTASGIRIVVKAGGTALSAADVERFVGSAFAVEAELAGPGLAAAITIPQPGDTPNPDPLLLPLPPLTVAGDYELSNIRIVANGQPVLDTTPPRVALRVIDQILVTSVTTRPLTLDEIKEKGIVLDSDSYLGFQFTMGMLLDSKVVSFSFPAVFDSRGVPVPLPLSPPPNPAREISGVAPAPLPTIVPLLLDGVGVDGRRVPLTLPQSLGGGEVHIPSVLVIPGNVGYLKQFFSAQLYVANGAPGGSGLIVRDVTGTIKLPTGGDGETGTPDDPLTLPATVKGAQPATRPVMGVGLDGQPDTPDDTDAFGPAEQGQAEFLIRGEREGFYTIDFDIAATLQGLPVGPVKVGGRASGGVLVRNAYFDMAFTVPSVVRAHEPFRIFVSVTNIGQSLANAVSVTLDRGALSGMKLLSDATLSIDTLRPGDSKELEFRFEALRTGQVRATYLHLDTDDGSTGELRFTMGVDERGVPLSPDTLALPAAVDAVPSSVIDAAMRVLGQAWSVANAPSGTLPSGITRTSKTVVTQKALALAEAGLRITLGETQADAVRDLAFDWYGGQPLDPGFDQLLRSSDAGQALARGIGAFLRDPSAGGAENAGNGMVQAGGPTSHERALAEVAASGADFISFAVASGQDAAPVSVTLSDAAGHVSVVPATPSENPRSEIPGTVFVPLGTAGSSPALGLVLAPRDRYTLRLVGHGEPGTLDLSVTIPRGDGTFVRGVISGVAITPGLVSAVTADLSRPDALVLQQDPAGDGSFGTRLPLTLETISARGPRLVSAHLIGPETLAGASPFGFHAALLFDRIVDATSAGQVSSYSVSKNGVRVASRQLSGRLVFLTLEQPEGAYVPVTVAEAGVLDSRGVEGAAATAVPLESRLTDPGAVVLGRVLNTDGTPAAGLPVTYANNTDMSCLAASPAGLARVSTDGNGRYEFRFVRQDNCGQAFEIHTQDPVTGASRVLSTKVRFAGEQIVLDLALLGRGSVAGTVFGPSGAPVSAARVVARSVTDNQSGGAAVTDAAGRYFVDGISVGGVSVAAASGGAAGQNAGTIPLAGATATVDVQLVQGFVSISGTVRKTEGATSTAVAGVQVVYWVAGGPVGVQQTGANGEFAFDQMPSGPYRIEAALNTRDRGAISGPGFPGEVEQNQLIDIVVPQESYGTVSGTVRLPGGAPATSAAVPAGIVVSLPDGHGILANADGTYVLAGVLVRPAQTQVLSAQTRDGLRQGSGAFQLDTAGQNLHLDVTLSGLGSATYTVLDPQGRPLANQLVLQRTRCSDPCGCDGETTDVQGKVTFENLPVGPHLVHAVRVLSAYVDSAEAGASVTQDGAEAFGILRFNGAGTVTGQVLTPDTTPQPVMGAQISVSSLHFVNDPARGACGLVPGESRRFETGSDGRFSFGGINVGRVDVTARQSFYPTAVGGSANLGADGGSVDLALKMVNTVAGVLSGTVFLPDGTTPVGAGVEITARGTLPDVTIETAADGSFHFGKIFPAGLYTLLVKDAISGAVAQDSLYLNAGQDVSHDLRLKGRAAVRVSVVDGADRPVASAFVRVREASYPNRSYEAPLDPSTQGIATFESVFEGPISVEASDPLGRGGRTSSTIPQGGGLTVDVKVTLTTTGTVKGVFRMPDQAQTPIPYGMVSLTVGGRLVGQVATVGSGDGIGSYAFDYVPAGPVRLDAQDPATGRTGLSTGSISSQDQVLSLDVVAQALGTVTGTIRQNGVAKPQARVEISSGSYRVTTYADADGRYSVQGVPEGRIAITASQSDGSFAGTNSGTLVGEGGVVTIDVDLWGTGSVEGQVVGAVAGTSTPISVVTLSAGGNVLSTGTEAGTGRFSFHDVAAGAASLAVDVLGSIDTAAARVTVAENETASVTIKLNGVGSIQGIASDSFGNPAAGVLTVTGSGAFPYSISVPTTLELQDGRNFRLPELLAGPFTARLRVQSGAFTLWGTTAGTLLPGQSLGADAPLVVQLQDSGTVKGRVLRSDGSTPAYGSDVRLTSTVGGSSSVQAQADGWFEFDGVPLGGFTLDLTDPITTGRARVTGQLGGNGETNDVGSLILDDTAISVVSISPVDGATLVPVDQPVRIVFSDPLQGTGGVFVATAAGAAVWANGSLSADGRTLTMSPAFTTWPDAKTLVVSITTGVTDVFGRTLAVPATSRFTTVDLSPPSVASIAPVYGAAQVEPAAAVTVTFSEDLIGGLDPNGIVVLGGPTGAVAGDSVVTGPRTVVFTPAQPLLTDTRYTVMVNGAVDLTGNRQTAPYVSAFSTIDTIPPVAAFSSALGSLANGSWLKTAPATLTASFSDALSGVDMTRATLSLDGTQAAAQVQGNALVVSATGLGEGTHTLSAAAADLAGNTASPVSITFGVDATPPVSAAVGGVVDGQVVAGTVPLLASVAESGSGLARLELMLDGTASGRFALETSSLSLNTTTLSEGRHALAVRATDVAGNVGAVGPAVTVIVDNHVLTVSVGTPARDDLVFGASVAVSATPSEPVDRIELSVGPQLVSVTAAPYAATLDLTGLSDGAQQVLVTAFGQGSPATATRRIVVDHTPPPAPDASVINAEPPTNGASLVFGRQGAVEASTRVDVVDTRSLARATAVAASDGSFSLSVAAAADDPLSLTATDGVGNVSAPTMIVVRRTPSLPPASGSTSLSYQGVLVDRVGPGPAALAADGAADAVFTMTVAIGDGVTRQLSYVDLQGPVLRSTRPSVGSVLGVSVDAGAAFLNGPDGQISLPITSGATLTLTASAGGFVVPGSTYAVTAAFTDGSRFIGTYQLVAAEDKAQVAHSATIVASPATVVGTAAAPATTTLTISDVRDIDGTTVPDGAKLAVSVQDMASKDPAGNAIRSAGGTVLDGTAAANNASFRVYTIENGTVTATYSNAPVTPVGLTGAQVVMQVQAADAGGNVLGSKAVATYDLNVRAPGDGATVLVAPSQLYADKADRRSHVVIRLVNPAYEGTSVAVTAADYKTVANGAWVRSAGGTILGGAAATNDAAFRVFVVQNGAVECDYSSTGIAVNAATIATAFVQVVPANSAGSAVTSTLLGTAAIALSGAAAADVELGDQTVPTVSPARPVQVVVHDVHDARAGLVPDGANLLLTANDYTSVLNGTWVRSAGGQIVDGIPSPTTGAGLKSFPLSAGELVASYSSDGVSANTGETKTASIQLLMGDPAGARLDTRPIAVTPLELVAPTNAVGAAVPPDLLADGGLHTSTITFAPVLDSYGDPLPDGSLVVASASDSVAVSNGSWIRSAGGQILDGSASPSGTAYKVLTVQGGAVAITYSNQGIRSAPGAIQIANVVLLQATSTGAVANNQVIGVVPVKLSGLTSASLNASPAVVHADGGDQRATVTISDFRDAAGEPVPDGSLIAVTAQNSGSVRNGFWVASAGGSIVGGTASPSGTGYRVFPVSSGQVVLEYSAQGVAVNAGEQKTAAIQLLEAQPDGAYASNVAAATLEIRLVGAGSAVVAAAPPDLLADAAVHLSQITLSDMMEADGVTPIPDGSRIALTAANSAAAFGGSSLPSAGGTLLSAGVSPGDGTPATDSRFRLFTVAGGQVRAAYSDEGLTADVGETRTATIAAIAASSSGALVSPNAFALGTVKLRGLSSATGSGPQSLRLGQTATVTFSGIKDAAGNTVPDGSLVLVTAANNGSGYEHAWVSSSGGTIDGGSASPSGAQYRLFTVTNGTVTVPYSTAGAAAGTARVQLLPAKPDGSFVVQNAAAVWAITVTN